MENKKTIKEIAEKYNIPYHIVYQTTYGVDHSDYFGRGREYNEQQIVGNLKALIEDRIRKRAREIADLQEMLKNVQRMG